MDILFNEKFLDETSSDSHLLNLLSEVQWGRHEILLFGKRVLEPRLIAFFGDPGITYRYSGKRLPAVPWIPSLLGLKLQVEAWSQTRFNSVLLNRYRDGQDSMGWHQDNERELGEEPVIASLSFGASRIFKWRQKKPRGPATSILLTHGSLLLMQGQFQAVFEHSIPKTARPVGERINLTFRKIWI